MRAARSICRTADALSPPPTTVKPPHPATASATVRVPAANGAISKTPIGPFQHTVRAWPDQSGEMPGSLRTDVETLPSVGKESRADMPRRGIGSHVLRDDDVGRHFDASRRE